MIAQITQCPACGAETIVAQNIEVMGNSAVLIKLAERIQLCCQCCGWIAFTDPDL